MVDRRRRGGADPRRGAGSNGAPLLLGGAQSINALVHGVTSPLVAAFVLGLVAFAVAATRHSLASFRTESLEVDLFDRES